MSSSLLILVFHVYEHMRLMRNKKNTNYNEILMIIFNVLSLIYFLILGLGYTLIQISYGFYIRVI
jgi:hypothetical protein